MLRFAMSVLGVGEAESVTCTEKVKVPLDVGVPEIWPVVGLRLRPAGSGLELLVKAKE
jgi:hypothetical protein